MLSTSILTNRDIYIYIRSCNLRITPGYFIINGSVRLIKSFNLPFTTSWYWPPLCVKLSKYNKQLLIPVNCNSSIMQNVFNEQARTLQFNPIWFRSFAEEGRKGGRIKQRYPTLFVKYLEKCKVTTPVASVAMQSVEWFEFRELQFNFETFPLLWNQYLVCGIDFSCVNCRISLINLWYTVSIVNSSSFFLFSFFLSLFLSLHRVQNCK